MSACAPPSLISPAGAPQQALAGAAVDITEAFSEFLVPGVLLTGSAVLLVSDTSIGAEALENVSDRLGATPIAIFLLGLSYVAGVLCSEGGTAIVRKRGDRTCCRCIEARLDDLARTSWAESRPSTGVVGWRDFSYMRAACRTDEGLRSKVQSHENILRILRPCIVALPLSSLFLVVYIARNGSWPAWIDWLLATAIVSVVSIGSYTAFCQRLSSAVRSTIDHYLATYERH